MNHKYYVPHLEWEAVKYPLVLQDLEFEQPGYDLDDQSTITILRQEDLQLDGKISGRLKTRPNGYDDKFIGKGNIVQQQVIKGRDLDGNKITLSGCIFGGYKTDNLNINSEGYLIEIDLIFDKAHIAYGSAADQITGLIHYEWFLCGSSLPHFYGATARSLRPAERKIRVGIDKQDDTNEDYIGGSTSADYIFIDLPEISCIISKVPEYFIKKGMSGLCLEFRDENITKINGELMTNLKSFLSFFLGFKLYYMGYSKIENGELKEALIDSPVIPIKIQASMPPIQYNLQYTWGNVVLQANLLLKKYLELQDSLSLNHAIERLWIANDVPIGVNLPILAGAIEIIAGEYLKTTGNNKLEYLSKTEYEKLIHDEIVQLTSKLSGIEGGTIMLSKITGAFRKGPNEKMNLFFSLLSLETGKPEKEAINLRNKMTHGKRDYANDDVAYDDLVLSRVYQVLFNRIILRILAYDGFYIDYSIARSPSKPLEMKAGE